MKRRCTVFMIACSIAAHAQFNKPGTVSISGTLGGVGGFSSPGFTYNNIRPVLKEDASGLVGGADFGFRASVGVSNKVSIGLYVNKELRASVNTTEDKKHAYDVYSSATAIGPEVKIYLSEQERLHTYFAASLGYVSSAETINVDNSPDIKGTSSGLGYGASLGVNRYFSEVVGFSVDFGISGCFTKGEGEKGPQFEYSITNAGILLKAGLVFRLGNK